MLPKSDGFFKYLCWLTCTVFLLGVLWLPYTYYMVDLQLSQYDRVNATYTENELAQCRINMLQLQAELQASKAKECKCSDKCTCGKK